MPIMIFDIPQVIQVVVPESTGSGTYVLNNYPMNRADFRLVQGVQNNILFIVRDIDRKYVPTTGLTLTMNIVDPDANKLLLTRVLTVVDSTKALFQLTVLPADLVGWPIKSMRWSITALNPDTSTIMLWTDTNYGPYSTLLVTEGPTPGVNPGKLLVPSSFLPRDGFFYSSSLPGSSQTGYTSTTSQFTVDMVAFVGQIRIDGSMAAIPTQPDSDWTPIGAIQSLVPLTAAQAISVPGDWLWMRVAVFLGGIPIPQDVWDGEAVFTNQFVTYSQQPLQMLAATLPSILFVA